MRNPLNLYKKTKSNRGYSLIEMAIVLIIFGVLSASAIQVYMLYKTTQKIEQTEISILRATNALGDFREMYGRYPCPAKIDAVRGDTDYGYESVNIGTGDCTAVAGGVLLTTSNNAALPNQDVFIGLLPFRQLNLPEKLVSDGYKNRLSYAVTGLLANNATYNNTFGGISVIDHNDNDTINPAHSAHFIVISYNENDGGAVTQNGIISNPCPTLTLETENCDNDATFRVGLKQTDFDDLVNYSVTNNIQQWQLSNANYQDIHLRRADSIAMGINETTNTAGFNKAEILDTTPNDSIVRASKDTANSYDGQFFTSNICDVSGTNCFPSSAIAGQIASSEGMDCGTEFLVGIANGVPICESEITFSCPITIPPTFITGFDATGKVICDVLPPTTCSSANLTTTCGDSRTVSAFFDNGAWYGYAYSGDYYTIDPLNTATLDAFTSLTDVNTYIATINNSARTPVDAGPTQSTAMVRDTFKCTSGSWVTPPARTLERIDTTTQLTNTNFAPLYNTPSWPAETGGPAYVAATPMSVDINNDDWSHDCWCREDYRVTTGTCSSAISGTTGTTFKIEKQKCPQSGNSWTQVYPTSGVNTNFCGCSPGTSTTTPSCKSYFGYSGNGVTGNIVNTYTTTCIAGTPSTSLTNTDLSACSCPTLTSPIYSTDACPFGTTNSFMYLGVSYTGVNKVNSQDWVCPSGPAPVTPIASSAEAGYYTAKTTIHTEACVCNAALTTPHHENCAAGEIGTGKDYILPWNCSTSSFDAPSAANITNDDCHTCIWQAGSKRSGGPHATGGLIERGIACPSCTGTTTCHEVVGSGPVYDVWDACYCAGQP